MNHGKSGIAPGKVRGPVVAALLLSAACGLAPPRAAAVDLEAWRSPMPEQIPILLVQDATIWTSGPDGTLPAADLLIRNGKIAAVGVDLAIPAGAVIIDGRGKHLTPGIVDAHSHLGIAGGVNETGATITAEVRIEDVLNCEDPTIYRQLAGGVTAAQLLHGSANAIGGQSAVIKLRWGAPPDDLLFEGAPAAIKFALGENPKRTNRPDKERSHFPTTRAGIAQQIRERFVAAEAYRARWRRFRAGEGGQEPRRDLQLEALVEVLEGERRINAHSYRADEILMLLSLGDELGFSVAVLQHVLEGYKIAEEIAAHGTGASTFSDWWAYKFEVLDAIPYNAALMHERGVVVSLNSDSDELGRRLNLEAAKAVRYGGVEPEEALKMVTLNPAIHLGIEDRVGSLTVGKDGDFVLWSASPLSTQALCEETWIDGRRYFSRKEDLAARAAWAAERQALIAKIRALDEVLPNNGEATGGGAE